MAQSTVGEYTFAIFAVTSAALLISWVVSVYFVPYLGARFPAREAAGRPRRRT
jgi:multidrug efflux pump